MHFQRRSCVLAAIMASLICAASVEAACCYVAPKLNYIQQPSQKVLITWDPELKIETWTVQPKFDGNARDFGMLVPTPSQPKLSEMPRDFFKNLAVYSILMQREFPQSKLLPADGAGGGGKGKKGGGKKAGENKGLKPKYVPPPATIVILEEGVVGSLEYKIIAADRSDDLFKWLKDNRYQYAGDEATLNFYVQKKWVFTVMKIDALQMKRGKADLFNGDVAPMRFQFSTAKAVYPLRITQFSVKEQTEALFYVQAPWKVDLEDDKSYQRTWVPMLQASSRLSLLPSLPGRGTDWLTAIQNRIPNLLEGNRALDFDFVPGKRPMPNAKGRTPTQLEWARKLTKDDIAMLQGKAAYCEKVPNVDEGFSKEELDMATQARRTEIYNTIRDRLAKSQQDHPNGYLVRYVPPDDIKGLAQLTGHLHSGQWLTKFRKTFQRSEMNDDLLIVPARMGADDDFSEYFEMLPASPPQS